MTDLAQGYHGQPGYRPCQCEMCDDAAERGCRRLALPMKSDRPAFLRLRLWSRRRAA